jgi:hypothetical protein
VFVYVNVYVAYIIIIIIIIINLYIYIYKKITVRLCVCEFVHVNLRKWFTDGFAIWTQRCRRIRACFGITFIYIYIIYIYEKTCFYAFAATRLHWLSTERKHLVP